MPKYQIDFLTNALILDSKITQIRFIFILCCQILFFIIPFFQSTVIKQFQVILNNEWNNIIFQALFKHDQPTYTPISVLKWVYSFKLYMKIQNIIKFFSFFALYSISSSFILLGNFL